MTSDSRRLSILTDQEVDDLYSLPRFTEEDRSLYFDLSPAERELVDGVFTVSVAVHLILQLGYFKAKRQFYVYSLDAVSRDLEHVVRRYFPARSAAEIKPHSRSTRLEHQQVILKLFDYRLCDAAAKRELERKAQRVAMLSTQPVFILREALQYLAHSGSCEGAVHGPRDRAKWRDRLGSRSRHYDCNLSWTTVVPPSSIVTN